MEKEALKYLKSYLKLSGQGFGGRFLSKEYKQFRKEIAEDQKLNTQLFEDDNIFSWLVKKAVIELEGNPWKV